MKWIRSPWLWGGLFVAFGLLQLVPVDRTNPPVLGSPAWDSAQTETLARRACFDCHSNETTWPWYAKVAPLSFWIAHHVEEGREHVNYSEPPFGRHVGESAEELAEGEMPLWPYDWIHREVRHLSAEEKAALVSGFKATFPEEASEHGEHDHDDD